MEKLVETCRARGDDGKDYVVNTYQRVIETHPINGPASQTLGSKRCALPDGSPVNWIDDKTFQVVMTDEIIRRV